MTHQELVKAASKWLVNSRRCGVVLTEIVTAASEIPDAIGWRIGRSVLIECKASRGDFLADKNKPTRLRGLRLGETQFFLTERGLIDPSELPPFWGLLEIDSKGRIKVVKELEPDRTRRPEDFRAEVDLLVSALRRIKQREFICIVPEWADTAEAHVS